MPFLDELVQFRTDTERRLDTCMKTLREPSVGDTAKSYFYGESLYLETTARRLEVLIRMYHQEQKGSQQ